MKEQNGKFTSPTFGVLDNRGVIEHIARFVDEEPVTSGERKK